MRRLLAIAVAYADRVRLILYKVDAEKPSKNRPVFA